MTDESWLARYVAAAQAHRNATATGDHVAANRAHRQLHKAMEKLLEQGADGRRLLLDTLSHPDPGVRLWAATHLLGSHPDLAIPVVERIMGEPGILGFNAKMVLEEFRRSHLPGS